MYFGSPLTQFNLISLLFPYKCRQVAIEINILRNLGFSQLLDKLSKTNS